MLHIIMYARVVELVDTLVLGTSAERREGSSPFIRTRKYILNDPPGVVFISAKNEEPKKESA